jgi:hypothetical protein
VQTRRFEELRAAGNVCVKVYARVRSEGGSPAGTWYECGEVAAAEGQSVQEAVWAAKTYIFEYSTWQFPALLAKKRLLEVCVCLLCVKRDLLVCQKLPSRVSKETS